MHKKVHVHMYLHIVQADRSRQITGIIQTRSGMGGDGMALSFSTATGLPNLL